MDCIDDLGMSAIPTKISSALIEPYGDSFDADSYLLRVNAGALSSWSKKITLADMHRLHLSLKEQGIDSGILEVLSRLLPKRRAKALSLNSYLLLLSKNNTECFNLPFFSPWHGKLVDVRGAVQFRRQASSKLLWTERVAHLHLGRAQLEVFIAGDLLGSRIVFPLAALAVQFFNETDITLTSSSEKLFVLRCPCKLTHEIWSRVLTASTAQSEHGAADFNVPDYTRHTRRASLPSVLSHVTVRFTEPKYSCAEQQPSVLDRRMSEPGTDATRQWLRMNRPCQEEDDVVVIDVGAAYTRCGWASDRFPSLIISGAVPLEESLPRFATEMAIDFSYFTVIIITQTALKADKQRAYEELLFAKHLVPALTFQVAGVLSLAGQDLRSGIAVDLGTKTTAVTAVSHGHLLPASETVGFGGEHLDAELRRLLLNRYDIAAVNAFSDLELRAFKEAHCFVAEGPDSQPADCEIVALTSAGDGGGLILQHERWQLAELIFSDVDRSGTSLAEKIVAIADKCESVTRRALYANIVLSGGGSLLPGLAQRLQQEVQALLNAKQGIDTAPKQRWEKIRATKGRGVCQVLVKNSGRFAGWQGAALLPEKDQFWNDSSGFVKLLENFQ